jgi:hypothetical protein
MVVCDVTQLASLDPHVYVWCSEQWHWLYAANQSTLTNRRLRSTI